MKKPDKTKSSSLSETSRDTTPLMLKKEAAEPGIIAQTDIGAGDGSAAAATGAEIRPVESTLLGDGTDQHPPAARKPETGGIEAPAEADKAEAVKAADTPIHAATLAARPDAQVTPPAQKVTVKKTGFWPVVLGGVVAAGLGSAATIWALPHLPAGWLPPQPAAQPAEAPQVDVAAIRSEAVSAARAATAEQIDALRAELAAAPDQPEAPAGPSAEDLAALRQQIDQQAAQIGELSARPQIAPELAARVQTLADQADTLEQQLQTAAQAAQAQINAAQAEAQQLQEAAAETTRRAEAVAAIAALQTALDRGVTPDQARQTLEGAGIETPEALTREVPSLDSLQASFPEAARAALRASLQQDSAAGNGSLFGNFIRAQTGARSVEPREGTDPDAVLSRADAAVQEGRIADALTEVEALPDDARAAPAMAEWLTGATTYRDAQAALSDLSAPSN
ncbi:hypothetical protein GIY56_06155 [Paracoccus sp. YIM 132242]|uniref:Uncharacterized protein n=1 Tax=Paracoccus lichenicola TaxID=2665644 RepID=A0A6L6HN89_9RHOB|nr:hypothetical protein [Paracoccus lichenicola]MTD99861.1 hypothetical protein [Paracoccus lichenicola]